MSNRFELPTLEPLRPAEPMPVLSEMEETAAREAQRAAARTEGYAEGHAQGLAEARAQYTASITALQAAVAELTLRRDALCDAVEPAAVSLALAGAEQIVGAALGVKPELIENAARGAMRRLVQRDHVTVLVNPSDLEHMREFAQDLADQLGGIEQLDVQAERRVASGGVIVQTPTGDVDARLDTRMAQLGEVVRDALSGNLS
ncbi:MAG: FliH/SctL family protein [Solirubrobacteraceae bacterium]|nr:FliH/SctL family protein [Solirubrobacteraceae bacterium]